MKRLLERLGLGQTITIVTEGEEDSVVYIWPWELIRLAIYVTRHQVRPHEDAAVRDVHLMVMKEALRRRGFKPGVTR